jgi:hypothetical protein
MVWSCELLLSFYEVDGGLEAGVAAELLAEFLAGIVLDDTENVEQVLTYDLRSAVTERVVGCSSLTRVILVNNVVVGSPVRDVDNAVYLQ